MSTTLTQRNFAGGELAPSQHKKVDLVKYQTGAKTIRNFIIIKDGGLSNRPGTKFLVKTTIPNFKVRLIPFVYNNDQAYVLEFGHLYIKVIKGDDYVLEAPKSITGITNATEGVITSVAHGYGFNDLVRFSGIAGMTELNGKEFYINYVNANSFKLFDVYGNVINTSAFGAYISGGTMEKIPYISTPYGQTDLQDIQFIQSADVMTLTHPSYNVAELKRLSETNWQYVSYASFFAPLPSISGQTATAVGSTGSASYFYQITSVNIATGEESSPTTPFGVTNGNATLSQTNYNQLVWTMTTGYRYHIYRSEYGSYGLIGIAQGNFFNDIGILPDTSTTPPKNDTFFDATGKYPSAVAIIQQRKLYANTDLEPETVWASRIGIYSNLSSSSPIQDDDGIKFTMAGRQVNAVRYMIDLNGLVIFTQAGEWTAGGDSQGVLTPTGINLKQFSYNGAAPGLPPIIIDNIALYVQARGSVIRTLGAKVATTGYEGDDLTAFAHHLFKNHTIKDWAFQQTPNSVLWAVRDDGILLALTYIREQQIFGWHRHDTDGFVEQVCCIPDGNEDALYLVVKRTIDGAENRYIEKMSTRNFRNLEESILLDSYLTYDGRNYDATHSMTLSGGSTWAHTETLTLTSSFSLFTAGDIDNEIHITGPNEEKIRFKIKAFTSGTIVTGTSDKTVPVSMRSTPIFVWRKAVDEVSGLDHLNGKKVAVFADGFVVASPNNPSYPVYTVTAGKITLDKPYGLIHVGLPYISDLETLDIDTAQGESLVAKFKNIGKIIVSVLESKGFWLGGKAPTKSALDGLVETKSTNFVNPDMPSDPKTSDVEITIPAEWNSNGRVFARVVDPVPVTITAVSPVGLIPLRGG